MTDPTPDLYRILAPAGEVPLYDRLAFAFDAEGNNNHPSVLATVALDAFAPELAALDAAERKLAALRALVAEDRVWEDGDRYAGGWVPNEIPARKIRAILDAP